MGEKQIPGFRIEEGKYILNPHTLPSLSPVEERASSCWKFFINLSNAFEELTFDMERTLDSRDSNNIVDSKISAEILRDSFIPQEQKKLNPSSKERLIEKLQQFANHFERRSKSQRDKTITQIYNQAIMALIQLNISYGDPIFKPI